MSPLSWFGHLGPGSGFDEGPCGALPRAWSRRQHRRIGGRVLSARGEFCVLRSLVDGESALRGRHFLFRRFVACSFFAVLLGITDIRSTLPLAPQARGARAGRLGVFHAVSVTCRPTTCAARFARCHATPVELPERTAARIGCAMRRDQAAVGGIRTNLAVIGLRIGSVGAILFRSCGTPVAGSTRSARGSRVSVTSNSPISALRIGKITARSGWANEYRSRCWDVAGMSRVDKCLING